jgi:hypothetical protein
MEQLHTAWRVLSIIVELGEDLLEYILGLANDHDIITYEDSLTYHAQQANT